MLLKTQTIALFCIGGSLSGMARMGGAGVRWLHRCAHRWLYSICPMPLWPLSPRRAFPGRDCRGSRQSGVPTRAPVPGLGLFAGRL